MTVLRPLEFLLYDLLERLFGPRRAAMVLEAGYQSRLAGLRPAIAANLGRILRSTEGAEPAPGRVDALLSEMAGHYTRSQISICISSRDPRAAAREVSVDLLPALKDLLAQGKGAILASPHFGDINALMALPLLTGIPLTVVLLYARPYDPAAGRPFGLKLITLGRSAAPCLAALRANEAVLLYSDLDFHPGGRRTRFFGGECVPPHGPARLALASGAPILPAYAVWRGGQRRLECDQPILITSESRQEAIEESLLRSMESYIGRYPAQWLMLRDYWDMEASKTRNRRQLRLIRLIDRLFGSRDA